MQYLIHFHFLVLLSVFNILNFGHQVFQDLAQFSKSLSDVGLKLGVPAGVWAVPAVFASPHTFETEASVFVPVLDDAVLVLGKLCTLAMVPPLARSITQHHTIHIRKELLALCT